MTPLAQPGILVPVARSARYIALGLRPGGDPRPAMARLADHAVTADIVVGLGAPLLLALGRALPEMRTFPAITGAAAVYPSTQGALWLAVAGDDPGDTLHAVRRLLALLGDAFLVEEEVSAFRHGTGRDLTGYEDGTENPKDARAAEVALVAGRGPGLDGGSFVAVQRYQHDLAAMERLDGPARDAIIGRRHDTNEELADAPASAHVKRAAQESFDPTAFMVRRSMPWGEHLAHGLYFVAYGATLDPFERVLRRMAGLDDGIVDALATFTRALSGGYYFCPPLLADGAGKAGGARIDLSVALG